MKSKVLVTGGMGYIGSHTVVELLNSGYEVIIIDNLSNSKIDVLDGIESITKIRPHFEKIDLTNSESLSLFFQKYKGINAIIHFAASKAVGESVEKPLMYYRNNLISLMNVLEGMKQLNIPNIVFSSSCTVYGQPDELPVTENAPIKKALSPYGNTKQICEEILCDFTKAFELLKVISLRYFNPIGAHESSKIGELPLGVPANLVPFITQTAIGIRNQLKIYGNDYNTPDGSCIRDYINVVDLAKAHVISIERLLSGKNKTPFEVFNIGTGNGTSVFEIISSFERTSGLKLPYEIVERRSGDIEKVWADTTYANNELGWKSEKNLDETIHSAWKWEQHIRKNV